MTDRDDLKRLEQEVERELPKAAEKQGVDLKKINDGDVTVTKHGDQINVRAGDVEVTFPTPPPPSQGAIDAIWKQAATIAATALVVLAGVAVGKKLQ